MIQLVGSENVLEGSKVRLAFCKEHSDRNCGDRVGVGSQVTRRSVRWWLKWSKQQTVGRPELGGFKGLATWEAKYAFSLEYCIVSSAPR